MEIEFTFAKQSAVIAGPASSTMETKKKGSNSGEESKNAPQPLTSSPVEFSVSAPSTMKIPSNGSVILNIQAKLKNSYQLQNLKDAKAAQTNAALAQAMKRPEKYNHLLIAKIKDTQVMFSFIIEATVIEQQGPMNAMS